MTHLVVNCRTQERFESDTLEEAHAEAQRHQEETERLTGTVPVVVVPPTKGEPQ